MTLQTLYIVLGIAFGGGGLAGLVRGLWRIAGASHKLLGAITDNTAVTGRLARDLTKWRKASREKDREFDRRITRLELGHGKARPTDPRSPNGGTRRRSPDRSRRLDPP
ncbi:MAG: hypothetical protein ACRDVE_18015 [Actinocrinis sp.]